MEVKRSLGTKEPNDSMFVKLCELPEYIKISQELHKPVNMVSGISPQSGTMRSTSGPELTWNASIESLQEWQNSLIKRESDHQRLIEHYMSKYNCSRQEAKIATFGERYGLQKALHEFGNRGIVASICGVHPIDFSNLERSISPWHAYENGKV
jgi:hypothetical protein